MPMGKKKLPVFFRSLRSNRRIFHIGLGLLIINPPLGWLGAAIGATLACRHGEPGYLLLGAAIYVFSWLLLGIGLLLAGPHGLEVAREEKRRLRRRIGKRLPPRKKQDHP